MDLKKPVSIGQVYVVCFSDGWVKVGRGRSAAARIKVHQSSSKIRGAEVSETIESGVLIYSDEAEKRLVDFCVKTSSERSSREWFKGVDIGKLRSIIENEFESVTQEEGQSIAEIVRDKSREAAENMLRDFQRIWSEKSIGVENKEHRSFVSSFSHAQVLFQMYRGWMYGGDIFVPQENGISRFHFLASIALHSMSDEEISTVYVDANEEPRIALEDLMNKGDAHVRAYQSSAESVNSAGDHPWPRKNKIF